MADHQQLAKWVFKWTHDAADEIHYGVIDDYIRYMEAKRYHEYEPTRSPAPDFRTRLIMALESVEDHATRRVLFRLIPHLFFLGKNEFHGLYRLALNEAVAFWLMNELDILPGNGAVEALNSAVDSTWFCPITDSMQIASFYHVNNISGFNHRPAWHVLAQFGDGGRLNGYMEENEIERLVLLEDFVGSGTQMRGALEFAAAEISGDRPILVVPLVACPGGVEVGKTLESKYSHLSFSPVLALPKPAFVTPTPHPDEPAFFDAVRTLVEATEPLVAADGPEGYSGPFGFADTGGLVVMYTNCPNNSLPLIHRRTRDWNPVFPRSSRM